LVKLEEKLPIFHDNINKSDFGALSPRAKIVVLITGRVINTKIK
jgi:hypothetical protein